MLVHRRQGRLGVPADRRVVEPDQRDVVGDPEPGLAQHPQRADRHQVGGREHGIRDGSGGEHLTHGALSAVLAVVPERDDDAVAVDTSCSHGVARAGEAVAAR